MDIAHHNATLLVNRRLQQSLQHTYHPIACFSIAIHLPIPDMGSIRYPGGIPRRAPMLSNVFCSFETACKDTQRCRTGVRAPRKEATPKNVICLSSISISAVARALQCETFKTDSTCHCHASCTQTMRYQKR